MSTVWQTFCSTLEQKKLFLPAHHILLAVSGGLDSMVLLALMVQWRAQWGVQISVAHYDHAWRADSQQDAEFVKQACECYGLPYFSGRSQTQWTEDKTFSEDAARVERYTFLQSLVQKHNMYAVVTAHHQDDQAETVLLRLLRGTGLSGLRGMSMISDWKGMRVVRPLLGIARADLEVYATKENITFRTDSSNEDVQFLRNKIRHQLMPFLQKEFNPAITHLLSKTADSVGGDYDYIEEQASQALEAALVKTSSEKITFSLPALQSLNKALLSMIFRISTERLTGQANSLSWAHIVELEELVYIRPKVSIVDLPLGIQAKTGKDTLIFQIKNV